MWIPSMANGYCGAWECTIRYPNLLKFGYYSNGKERCFCYFNNFQNENFEYKEFYY
jgi:hypothetical protein